MNDDGSVPKDNPFVGKPGYLPEIYTMGHRNQTGLRFDPATGKFGPPPPSTEPPSSERPGEEEPLVEEPGTTDAGGMTVDLKGRFRTNTKVTVDPAGKVRTPCEPPAATR